MLESLIDDESELDHDDFDLCVTHKDRATLDVESLVGLTKIRPEGPLMKALPRSIARPFPVVS